MNSRARRYRRRGTVMIMVIGLLVMLFMVGTTFLLTARFDKMTAKTEAEEKEGGGTSSKTAVLLNALHLDLLTQLRLDLVGSTGVAYDESDRDGSGDAEIAGVRKDYADAPGLDGLLASIEPYYDTTRTDPNEVPDWVWYRLSTPHDDLDEVTSGQQYPGALNADSLFNVAINDRLDGSLVAQQTMQGEWFQVIGRRVPVVPDADGDGMPDSMIWTKVDRPDDLATPAIDERLLLDEESETFKTFGDRYVGAVRVIPHGGMVTAYYDPNTGGQTPASLVDAVRHPADGAALSDPGFGEAIVPEQIEAAQRRRFFLPSRQDRTLLEQFWPNTLLTNVEIGLPAPFGTQLRSWMIDYDYYNPPRTLQEWWWEDRMNPGLNTYDRRHLITTVSYDDIYRRRTKTGTWENIEILQDAVGNQVTLGQFLDGYPTPGAGGVVMFSLSSLQDSPAGSRQKGEQLADLYAFFRAMLEHSNLPQKRLRAASLAINTWDYFDSDILPTDSSEIGSQQVGFYANAWAAALGIEGQPFVTEAFVADTNPVPNGFFEEYAVELFNPWPYDITLVANEWAISDGTTWPPAELSETITIPAANVPGLLNQAGGRNVSVISNVAIGGVAYQAGQDITNQPGLSIGGSGNAVLLFRLVNGNWRLVDQINTEDAPDDIGDWLPDPDASPGAYSESLRRELVQDTGIAPSTWKFCVGVERQVGGHTLGAANGVGTAGVAGVPLIFVDWGGGSADAAVAFPTTGSLLLVTAFAHVSDPMAGVARPLAQELVEDPFNYQQYERIDNGHMPIFDQEDAQRADINYDGFPNNNDQDIPWGQLVFDYFTVLPVDTSPQLPAYPVVERVVDQQGNVTYGPRVKGRININAAPWTVLDGVPLSANLPPILKGASALDELEQAVQDHLDPGLANQLILQDDGTLSTYMARAIVSYRERRNLDPADPASPDYSARGGGMAIWAADPNNPTSPIRREPGFVSVGELAHVVGHELANPGVPPTIPPVWPPGDPRHDFLHFVAPLVALSDWVTVKSHTYTIYATVVDKQDPDNTLRAQWTVDRTRCLYTNQLPEVVGSPVIVNYFATDAD